MSFWKYPASQFGRCWHFHNKRKLTDRLLLPNFLFYRDGSRLDAHPLSTSCFKNYPFKPKLSPQEVNQILRHNEQSLKLKEGDEAIWDEARSVPSLHAISSADSNQLASNTPIEDKISVARCLHTTGFLFGVYDGHGGAECSQVVSKRLCDYIAASFLPRSVLRKVIEDWEAGHPVHLTEVYNDKSQFVSELQEIYSKSLLSWCKKLLVMGAGDFSMEDALTGAFCQLDEDMSSEVLSNKNSAALEPLLRVALSGSVVCIGHIDGPHLHIANTGDCGAVLGKQVDNSNGGWLVQRLTTDHNWENPSEIKRIKSGHPTSEEKTIIQNQRLLGMLMPFRAFGDFRFKWDMKTQREFLIPFAGEESLVPNCLTPPYLTCKPEIFYHRLQPHDKFLLMASDGLWEGMNPLDAVTLVGEYMAGRQTFEPIHLPKRMVTLNELNSLLEKRQEGLKLKPSDTNAATHLIRHSLGSTEEGLDHARLSHSLTLPIETRRYFRDDISIHVINFDSHFLRICPREL